LAVLMIKPSGTAWKYKQKFMIWSHQIAHVQGWTYMRVMIQLCLCLPPLVEWLLGDQLNCCLFWYRRAIYGLQRRYERAC